MRDAANAHRSYALMCRKGLGFDRHLFALRSLAKNGLESDYPKSLAAFEQSEYCKVMDRIRLSTSGFSSYGTFLYGFGPVIDNGIGIAYSIKDDSMAVCVTKNYNRDFDAKMLTNAIEKALIDMFDVLSLRSKL